MNRKRVLYADNDRNYLDARCEFLEREGFEVIKASSPEEAEQALERENIHLAVLDIRLVDDNDDTDISGILLAKDERFKRVPKIFVTGFPTYEAVREAYGTILGGEPIAHAFLAKKEGPKAMVAAVNSAFEQVVGINWALRVTWDQAGLLSFPYLALLVEGGMEPGLLAARSSQLGDLFRKLFASSEQISIERLSWVRAGCACLSLYALDGRSSRQAVLLFGRWDAVDAQRQGVGEYLKVESGVIPQPSFAETLRYAALAFTFPDSGDGPLQDFPSFFREAQERSVRAALESLYQGALGRWRQHERAGLPAADLGEIYRRRLGILPEPETCDAVRRRLQELAGTIRSYGLMKDIALEETGLLLVFPNGVSYRGPDPVTALFDPAAFERQPAAVASTFGGISAAALLVDPAGRVFPTGWFGITRSPLLEDFISLECEFHFEHMGTYNLLTLWDFETQLAKASTLSPQLPPNSVEPDCRKALSAINELRRLAAQAAGEALPSYLTGLFHYTMRGLLDFDPQDRLPKHRVAQLAHRLAAASLILDQIERLSGDGARPSAGPVTASGLQISQASREVSVDGREVRLTQTEFKLLQYLHKNAGRLCSREEILAEVFEIAGKAARSEYGLLNTHIDRLRKKIDVNPARHRYIKTIRGEGYLLDLEN